MKIIQQRRTDVYKVHHYVFEWREDRNSGFHFPADEDGNILWDDMQEPARENYRKCKDGTYDVVEVGHVSYDQKFVHPRIGLCSCGSEVILDGFTCPCPGECGREYNSAGQLLAPREEWGWETGEDWRDLQDL